MDAVRRYNAMRELENMADNLGIDIPELNVHRLIITVGFLFYIATHTQMELRQNQLDEVDYNDEEMYEDDPEWNRLNDILDEYHECGFDLNYC